MNAITKKLMSSFEVVESLLDNVIKYSKRELNLEDLAGYRDELAAAITALSNVDISDANAADKERYDALVSALSREENNYYNNIHSCISKTIVHLPVIPNSTQMSNTQPLSGTVTNNNYRSTTHSMVLVKANELCTAAVDTCIHVRNCTGKYPNIGINISKTDLGSKRITSNLITEVIKIMESYGATSVKYSETLHEFTGVMNFKTAAVQLSNIKLLPLSE